ncbi:MAG: hypothetical protein ACI4GD_09590 [Lachnospiraceae bacterium]
MDKPKLLYASPFPPQPSGISDYSVMLVKALEKKFDITLYTEKYDIVEESLSHLPALKYGIAPINFDDYDYKIYNIGNNPWFHQYIYKTALEHPGMVILHDFIIYYLYVGYHQEKQDLYSSIYCNEGLDAFLTIKNAIKQSNLPLLEQKHLSADMPLNRELLASDNKLMVHSKYSYDKALASGLIEEKNMRKINIIKQMEDNPKIIDRDELFEKYNVPKDALLISSFGYIAHTKLNLEVARVVKKIAAKLDKKICYLMVGEGGYADEELQDGLILKTGYTELDEFNSFVEYSDIIVNLRYPSMGETSAAMLRILQTGKPCITNNGGWFSELPDDCVCKIQLDDIEGNLYTAVMNMIENEEFRTELSRRAKDYAEREYNGDYIVQQIYDFLSEE